MLRVVALCAAGTIAVVVLARACLRVLIDKYLPDEIVLAAPRRCFDGCDPALREWTAKRRQVADEIRQRAACMETGDPVVDALRRVK